MGSYYPFGLKHKGYNNIITSNGNELAQAYKFGGKEYQQELDINWYDVSARNYDPTIGRWFVIDALADEPEQVFRSPYQYGWNNPVYYSDPDGNCPRCWQWVKDFYGGIATGYGNGLTNAKDGLSNVVSDPVGTISNAASNHFGRLGSGEGIRDFYLEVLSFGGYNPLFNAADSAARASFSDNPVKSFGENTGEDLANKTIEGTAVATGAGFSNILSRVIASIERSLVKPVSTVADDLVTVRHHTSSNSAKSINKSKNITASRPAQGLPSGVDVEVAPFGPARTASSQLGAAQRGAFVQFKVPKAVLTRTPGVNPARNTARIVTNGNSYGIVGRMKFVRVLLPL